MTRPRRKAIPERLKRGLALVLGLLLTFGLSYLALTASAQSPPQREASYRAVTSHDAGDARHPVPPLAPDPLDRGTHPPVAAIIPQVPPTGHAPTLLPGSPPSAHGGSPMPLIQAGDPLIQNLVNSVSQTQIYSGILNLQDDDAIPGWDAGRSRYTFAPEELAVERDYIYQRLQALGLDVRYQGFSFAGTSQANVEGTLSGWGPGSQVVYIVCAHYDSTSDDPYQAAPGADDNASGTAAVLEAARVLSQYRYRHTLRFVTFAAEEQGLIGSYYYVREAREADTAIGGAINLDMIGWDSDQDDAMEVHAGTRSDSQALGMAFLNANATYGISLVPRYITSDATSASDHARFWYQGYPAILIIEDAADFNPYYHQLSDTLDKLDLPYAVKFVQASVATLAELAEIIPPGLNVQHTGPDRVTIGTPVALSVQYANPGPDPATGVVITGTLSPGLIYVEDSSGFSITQPLSGTTVWQVGHVAAHSRGSFVLTASLQAGLPVGAQLTSTLVITGVTPWDDPADNRASWTGLAATQTQFLPILFKGGD